MGGGGEIILEGRPGLKFLGDQIIRCGGLRFFQGS